MPVQHSTAQWSEPPLEISAWKAPEIYTGRLLNWLCHSFYITRWHHLHWMHGFPMNWIHCQGLPYWTQTSGHIDYRKKIETKMTNVLLNLCILSILIWLKIHTDCSVEPRKPFLRIIRQNSDMKSLKIEHWEFKGCGYLNILTSLHFFSEDTLADYQ